MASACILDHRPHCVQVSGVHTVQGAAIPPQLEMEKEDRSEQEQRLVARGVLIPPLKKRPASVSWPEPPGNVSDKAMEQVWREERESR